MKEPITFAYSFNRPGKETAHLTPSQTASGRRYVFRDAPGTRRADLTALVEGDAIRPGDKVQVVALSDLGQGRKAATVKAAIEAQGATVEVLPIATPDTGTERLSRRHPRRWEACAYWWSMADQGDALDDMSKVLGVTMDRNKANRLCGLSRTPPQEVRDQIKAECENESE